MPRLFSCSIVVAAPPACPAAFVCVHVMRAAGTAAAGDEGGHDSAAHGSERPQKKSRRAEAVKEEHRGAKRRRGAEDDRDHECGPSTPAKLGGRGNASRAPVPILDEANGVEVVDLVSSEDEGGGEDAAEVGEGREGACSFVDL